MSTLMNRAAPGAGVGTVCAGLNIIVFLYNTLFFFSTKEVKLLQEQNQQKIKLRVHKNVQVSGPIEKIVAKKLKFIFLEIVIVRMHAKYPPFEPDYLPLLWYRVESRNAYGSIYALAQA